MVANIHQQTALTAMSDAVDTLASQYRHNRGFNIRRDQIKEALSIILHGAQALINEEHELCDGSYLAVQDVIDAVDVCFSDAIEHEDELEALANPAFSQRYHGTLNRQQQGLSR